MEKSNLAIVTGINGAVGMGYAKAMIERGDSRVVGIGRREAHIDSKDFENISQVDLLDEENTRNAVEGIRHGAHKRVVLIHPIGKFKWEEEPPKGDEIDQEVFASNVTTFTNVLDPVLAMVRRMQNASLGLVMFGSVADKWNLPFIQSYTRSNNALRKVLEDTIRGNPDLRITATSLDLGTIDVGSERNLRPYADRKFWLTVEDLVAKSMPFILPDNEDVEQDSGVLRRVEIFKPKPGFDPSRYYPNHGLVQRVLHEEMGINKE